MKIEGIRGLISLKVSFDDEEFKVIHSFETEERLFSYIEEKIRNSLGHQLVDDLLIWREDDEIRVIIKIGEGPIEVG